MRLKNIINILLIRRATLLMAYRNIWIQIMLVCVAIPLGHAQTNISHKLEYSCQIGKLGDTTTINALIDSATRINTLYPDSALKMFVEATVKSKEIKYAHGIVSGMMYSSQVLAGKGMYTEGVLLCKEAIIYCSMSEQAKTLLPQVYITMAGIYQYQSNFAQAILYNNSAIAILEANQSAHPSPDIIHVYNNMGGIFALLGMSRQSLYYMDKAAALSLTYKRFDLFEAAMINKASIYNMQQQWQKSQELAQQSLAIAEQYNLPRLKYHALSVLGYSYLAQYQSHKALPYLTTAAAIHKEHNLQVNATSLYISIATNYYQLKRYAKAEEILLQLLPKKENIGYNNRSAEIHKMLAYIYQETGKYKEALEHYQLYNTINDTVKSKNLVKNASEFEVKYRIAEKDKELAQKQLFIAQQERKLERKNMLLASIIGGSALIILAFIGYYRNYRQKQLLQQLKAMTSGEEKERARIARDLHDGIGGMMASLNMHFSALQKSHPKLTEADDYLETLHILHETANEIRITAHNLMPELLLRYGFAEALRIYCAKIQSSNSLQINYQCLGWETPMHSNFELLIYRTLQELIQNIVKHAKAQTATVQIIRYQKKLSILVEDDGIGIKPNDQNGMGLASLQTRIQSLQGTFLIESVPGKGTSINIEFDIKKIKF